MATPAKSPAPGMATPAKSPTTPSSAAATVLSPARKRSLSGNEDHAAHRPEGAPHPPSTLPSFCSARAFSSKDMRLMCNLDGFVVEHAAVHTHADDDVLARSLLEPDDSMRDDAVVPSAPVAQETVEKVKDVHVDVVMDEASNASISAAPARVPASPTPRAGPATPAPATPASAAALAATTPIPSTPAAAAPSSTPIAHVAGTSAARTATPAARFATPARTATTPGTHVATPAARTATPTARTATPAPTTPAAPRVSPRSERRYSDHDLARLRAEIKAEILAEIAASAPPPGTPRSTPQYSARDVDVIRAQVTAELEAQHHAALADLDTQLRTLRDRNARLELEHREMLTILADADEKLAQLERDAADSRTRAAQAEQHLAKLKDTAKVESAKFTELETEYLRVRVRHQDLVADLDRARAKHVEDALVMANMREDLKATEEHARKVGEYTSARLEAANLEISKCHHAYGVELAALRAKLAAAESARKLAEVGEKSVRDRCVELTKISDELVALLDAKVAQAETLWCEYAARVEGLDVPGELPTEKREREERERKDAARAAKAARRVGPVVGEIGESDAVENMGADDAMLMADL
ncbi:hypothetical protein GGF32_009144 [Allomyces javanicus]|nr:hypothetical protein GGF32_009144 [Allomyces javanicus]